MSQEKDKIKEEEMPLDYYPPKDLANLIWGVCFDYKDVETNNIQERVKLACFFVEKIYKLQNCND